MAAYSLDLALRQPLTLTAISSLVVGHYAQAVLTILPNTFIIRLLLLPFILLQAWRCTVRFDFAALLAQPLGHQSTDRLAFWNLFFTSAMLCIAMRSFEWTFIKKPLRRYEVPQRHQDSPTERSLSPSNVLLDAFDLLQNQRGVGWSWSPNPFPPEGTPSTSIAFIATKTLLKLTVFDASQYVIQYAFPSVGNPGGGSIFDPRLHFIPRTALAAFATICGGVWSYALVDSMYHVALLIGRAVFRKPASLWPRAFHHPWMSTSIHEFWSFRWHQFLRHLFVTFGARPGGALFGKSGALMGAFVVSAVQHHILVWGIGSGTELMTTGGFFLLMGIGTVIEVAFKRFTGMRVRGWAGWTWTMLWTTLWGTFMMDGWARHGIFATVFFPDRLRLGKKVVDAITTLSNK